MTPERWRRLWALFEQAVDLQTEERQAFLVDRCGADTAISARLQALLEADRHTRSALDQPLVPAEVWQDLRDSASKREVLELQPGMELGSYRVGRRIGQGGMGSVFLAEHVDASLGRKAVIKVVRSDMDSEEIRRRLVAERSILAGLDHPNIARLYDSGAAEGGSPYFVQEYIDGEPLVAFCERHRSTLTERLVLFSKVCGAVQYAHQHLVVHRDLKPKNILVTEEGEPKLLDFGIAKLLDPSSSRDTEGLTEGTATWHRFLTPSYASPEQIRGERTTTVSDVYSLGVVLYELLTSRLPRRFEGRSLNEAGQLFLERDPPSPSSVTGDSRLSGDLDAIVLRALRTQPAERYDSAQEFVRDLERHELGLPVTAREGTWRYLLGRFISRHRRGVLAVATSFVLLLSFSTSLAFLARKVAAERDVAERERTRKALLVDLVQEVFLLGTPYKTRGQALTVRDALERSIPLLEKRLDGQPEIQADFLLVVGSILTDIGLVRSAREPLDQSLVFYRSTGDREGMVEALTKIASVQKRFGELEAAETSVLEALSIARELAHESPGKRTALLLARPLNEWVSVLCYRDDFSAAFEPAEEVLALTAEYEEGVPRRISIFELLAQARSAEGDYQTAAVLNREALKLRLESHGAVHPARVPGLNNLGSNLRRLGDLEGAAVAFTEAVDIERSSFDEDSGPHLPYLLSNLGGVSFRRGALEEAEDFYREARRVAEQKWGPEHGLIFAVSLRLYRAQAHRGDLGLAQKSLEDLLAEWRPRLGDRWRFAEGIGMLGETLSLQGQCDRAEPLLVESFDKIIEQAGHNPKKEAFERLKTHFERCDRARAIEPFSARFSPE